MSAQAIKREGPPTAALDVARIRADFPSLDPGLEGRVLAFLDSAASTLKPKPVIYRMAQFYLTSYANVHRGVYGLSQEATRAYEAARATLQRFLGASSPREIVFTRGTTEAINLVAATWGRANVGPGDEILISGMEHHSNIVPWQMLAAERGARLVVIPVTDTGEIELQSVERLLTPRTRIVSVVHVSNTLGTVNPVREIVEMAHARGAVVLLDGAQAAPHMPVDVTELGCDFYALSGHKLYGPSGIGALYGRLELLSAMPPYQGGGDMIKSVTFEKTEYAEPPARFEAGTPHIAGAVGLAGAIEYLESWGREAVRAQEDDVLQYAVEQLDALDGVRIIGRPTHRSGGVSFVVEGVPAFDVGTLLDEQGVAVRTGHHCTQPLMAHFGIPATARASVGMYNSRADIDALAVGLAKIVRMFG
jgi:cysteine desulfurase/selenocysteine lyase